MLDLFDSFVEGSLETKLPTVWTDGKAQPGRGSEMEKVRREKIRDGEDQNGRNTLFFQCFVAPEGRKVGAKAAGAEPLGQKRREKLHAALARSTFGSKKCQGTSFSEHFGKLRC